MGVAATQWDGRAFVAKGDFVHGMLPVVEFPATAFHLQNQVRVATAAAIDQFFTANANATALGPFAAGDADTEVIRPRTCMFVPPTLISILLSTPLTPREAWTRLRGELVRQGLEAECAPLVDWLRAALTKALNHPDSISASARQLPTAPILDQALMNHRHTLVIRDLPARNAAVTTGADAAMINAGIGNLTNTIRQGQIEEQNRLDAKANKMPRDYFKAETQNLCNLCHVPDQAGLPPIYLELARASNKREERRLLQSRLDQERTRVNRHIQITATTELYTLVSMLMFRMTDIDNLSSGLNPFIFCQHNPHDEEAALRSATLHDALYSDHARATVQELQAMLKGSANNASILPPSHLHGITMLCKHLIALRVLLPAAHPAIAATQQFITTWQARATEMQARQAVTLNHSYRVITRKKESTMKVNNNEK